MCYVVLEKEAVTASDDQERVKLEMTKAEAYLTGTRACGTTVVPTVGARTEWLMLPRFLHNYNRLT